jgi:flavin reductase (DIM6/NTAB) family NADH-FMN oxidoreductase RutF
MSNSPLGPDWLSFPFEGVGAIPGGQIYKLLVGAVVPRPIAFVSSISPEGVGNLAPFSFFNAVSSDPPALVISVSRKANGEKKDTLRNIELNRCFVVNTVSDWMTERMNQTAAAYPYGVDELSKVGLTAMASTRVKAVRVKEAAIQMECELMSTLEIGEGKTPGSTTLVVGRILMMHVNASVHENGAIAAERLLPIARLGGHSYSRLGEVFELPRPLVPANE